MLKFIEMHLKPQGISGLEMTGLDLERFQGADES